VGRSRQRAAHSRPAPAGRDRAPRGARAWDLTSRSPA
jgi:hypothetical protein